MNELKTKTTTDCVIINTMPLMVKEYNNRRVVTFKDIDTLHQRPDGTASRNFISNRQHFIENVDYFLVKTIDVQNNEIRGFEIPTRGLTIFTESGYLMLTKSLTDDLAWKVQRELVNTYFRAKNMLTITKTFFQTLINKISSLETEIVDMRHYLETKKPTQPNFWLWKKHIANKVIDTLVEIN